MAVAYFLIEVARNLLGVARKPLEVACFLMGVERNLLAVARKPLGVDCFLNRGSRKPD